MISRVVILDTGIFYAKKSKESMNIKLNWNFALKIWTEIEKYLNKIEEYIPLLPTTEDTKWRAITKTVALANKVKGEIFPARSDFEVIRDFIRNNKLKLNRDLGFIKMVGLTPLRADFTEEAIQIEKHKGSQSAVIFRYTSKYGSFYLKEKLEKIAKGREEVNGFYYKQKPDMEKIINALWERFDSCASVEGRGEHLSFEKVPPLTDPVSKSALKKINKMAERYKFYQDNGVPRTVMFVGPPGSGKTTAVLRLGYLLGRKTIRIESNSLGNFKPNEIRTLLRALKPTTIIVDDIDRVNWNEKSHILTVLEYIKMDNKDATLLLTANRVSSLDSAFVRPGRIDEIQWYKIPNNIERRELFDVYMKELKVEIPEAILIKLIDITKGLTGSWIKELVLQIKYSPDDDIFTTVESMIKLKNKTSYQYYGPDEMNADVEEDEYEEDEKHIPLEDKLEKPTFDDMIDEMNYREIIEFVKAFEKGSPAAVALLQRKLKNSA